MAFSHIAGLKASIGREVVLALLSAILACGALIGSTTVSEAGSRAPIYVPPAQTQPGPEPQSEPSHAEHLIGDWAIGVAASAVGLGTSVITAAVTSPSGPGAFVTAAGAGLAVGSAAGVAMDQIGMDEWVAEGIDSTIGAAVDAAVDHVNEQRDRIERAFDRLGRRW